MKIVGRVILFAAIGALGFWLWTVFFPSPERVIRNRLADLARTASYPATESLISRGARIMKLNGFFAKDVEINYEFPKGNPNTISGTDEITTAAQLAPMRMNKLRIELIDPMVALSADKESAVVDLTLRAQFPDEKDFFIQEMKFTLKKTKDGWIIIRIETVRTLSAVQPIRGVWAEIRRNDFPRALSDLL